MPINPNAFYRVSLRGVPHFAGRRSNLQNGIEIASPRWARNDNRGYQMSKQYYVHIMTNKNNTVLYTGVTNDLKRRAYQHKEKLIGGFTKKYNINKLVYYEVFEDAYYAISREKQLKGGSRQKKVGLINSINKEWKDLYDEL